MSGFAISILMLDTLSDRPSCRLLRCHLSKGGLEGKHTTPFTLHIKLTSRWYYLPSVVQTSTTMSSDAM